MVPDTGESRPEETRPFKVLSPGTTISHYRIIEEIGSGGMGVVYRAFDTRLEREVALKFLSPHLICDSEAAARFEQEAKAASALSHRNITTIHEIDEAGGRCFIVLEYVDGKTLKQVSREGHLSSEEILDTAIQLAEGLNAAHSKDIVHRDIKAANVLVRSDGVVKIMDFGLAKLRGAARLTKTGTTVGTLQYMSPEQLQGKDSDQRSDLFSLGVVLYEMITGRLPFEGDREEAVIYSILNDTPEPLARYKSDVPEGLQRIVDKALAKSRDERYQHADEMLADLRREKSLSGPVTSAGARPATPLSGKVILRILIPAAAVLVVALVLLIFRPFSIELGPGSAAIAQENSLAIMYFENVPDPGDSERVAHMITALLITDLSESRYMRVVSRQRLYDILKTLGKQDARTVDRDTATEVATAAGAKYILTGSILRTEPALVLTSGISDAATGEVVATQRVDGAEGEDLFAVVDRLSAEVRKDLSLPEAAMQEADRAVAEVTTDSQEAYQYYLEGRELLDKLYWTDAIASFERAVEADSTFAMAYGALAYAGYIVDAPVVWQKEHSENAIRFMDGATERERYFILAMDAYIKDDFDRSFEELERLVARYPDDKKAYAAMALMQYSRREYEEAMVSARKAIDLDPSHKEMLNILVYCYERLGDLDNAIEAVNTYIEVAPDEANPYDTRGDLYAYSGRVDRAIDSYKRALEIKPDFYNSVQKMGHMHLYSGNYEEAEMYYNRITSSTNSEERARGRSSLALIPLHRGKFEASLSVLRDGLAADRMDNAEPSEMVTKHRLLATALGEMGKIEDAIEHMEAAVALASAYGPRRVMVMTSALVSLMLDHGMVKEAEEELKEMKRGIDERGEARIWQYWVGMGAIERAGGNTDEALAHFETAAAQAPDWLFITRYCLARAYLEADRLSEAVEGFEYILTRYDKTRPFVPVWNVHAHYLLGLAYERSGWNDRAIGKYEEFLEIYKDADPGIPEVEDARSRIARLKTS